MKLNKKNKSETALEWKFTLSADELATAQKDALKVLSKNVKVKGFRPGKAPASAVKKEIDPNVLADKTVETAINNALIEALNSEKINPIDQPQIEIVKFVPESELEFTAKFDILPKIKLPNYKKLGVKPEIAKVSDEDLKNTLDRLQKGFAEEKTVKRAAKNGDKTLIDFTGIIDGKEFEGGKGTNYPLELGSGSFIPGFEEGIVGKKAGEEFDLELSFPKDYHAADFAGKKVTFKTKLNEVKEMVLPEINDEFAKKIGGFDKLDDLKSDIKKNLIVQKEQQLDEKFKNELVTQLAKKIKVEIPEVLLHDQIHAMVHEMEHNLSHYGQTLENYLTSMNKSREQWEKEDVKPAAEDRIKAGLAIAELAKELEIKVSDEEIDAELAKLKMQYQNSKEALKELDSPIVRRDISNSIMTNKAVDKLVEFNR